MPRFHETFNIVAPTQDQVPSLNLGNRAGREDLLAVIDHSCSELVILDTLYRFLPTTDPNDNMAMGEVFGALNEIAHRTGAALLILDHVAKGEHMGPVSHSALGAQIKGGAARVIIALRRTSKTGST